MEEVAKKAVPRYAEARDALLKLRKDVIEKHHSGVDFSEYKKLAEEKINQIRDEFHVDHLTFKVSLFDHQSGFDYALEALRAEAAAVETRAWAQGVVLPPASQMLKSISFKSANGLSKAVARPIPPSRPLDFSLAKLDMSTLRLTTERVAVEIIVGNTRFRLKLERKDHEISLTTQDNIPIELSNQQKSDLRSSPFFDHVLRISRSGVRHDPPLPALDFDNFKIDKTTIREDRHGVLDVDATFGVPPLAVHLVINPRAKRVVARAPEHEDHLLGALEVDALRKRVHQALRRDASLQKLNDALANLYPSAERP